MRRFRYAMIVSRSAEDFRIGMVAHYMTERVMKRAQS